MESMKVKMKDLGAWAHHHGKRRVAATGSYERGEFNEEGLKNVRSEAHADLAKLFPNASPKKFAEYAKFHSSQAMDLRNRKNMLRTSNTTNGLSTGDLSGMTSRSGLSQVGHRMAADSFGFLANRRPIGDSKK